MKEKFASSKFGDFNVLQELYRSNGGTVYKAVFKYDKKTYVVKERNLAELGKRKDMMNEVKLLQQLQHRNIVRCEGWFRDDVSSDRLYMVLEYCENGDLYHLLQYYLKHPIQRQQPVYLTEQQIWYIFQQITAGLYHLHENGIIHRDIKSLNILITGNYSVFKIGDLGVSRQLSEATLMIHTFYGTPYYLSPEMLENKAYNEKTDLWSLGILLYELCAFSTPFRAPNFVALMQLILRNEYAPISSHFSPQLQRAVPWLLATDYRKRPSIAQVVDYIGVQVGDKGGYYGQGLAPQDFPTYQLEHRKGQPPLPFPAAAAAPSNRPGSSPGAGLLKIPGVAPPAPATSSGKSDKVDNPAKQPLGRPSSSHGRGTAPGVSQGAAGGVVAGGNRPSTAQQARPSTAPRHRPTSPSPSPPPPVVRKSIGEKKQLLGGGISGGEESIDEDSLEGNPRPKHRQASTGKVPTTFVGKKSPEVEEDDDDTISTASGESIASASPPIPTHGNGNSGNGNGKNAVSKRRSIILPDPVYTAPSSSPSRRRGKDNNIIRIRGEGTGEGEGEEVVEVDIARVQIKLRKEIMKYRKLLQMRDFMVGGKGNTGNDSGNVGGPGQGQGQGQGDQETIMTEKLREATKMIRALEYSIDAPGGRIKRSLATQYAIPLVIQAKVVIPDPSAAVIPVMLFDDNLPVYFQPPPSGRRRSPSPPARSPAHNVHTPATIPIKPYNTGIDQPFLLPVQPPRSSGIVNGNGNHQNQNQLQGEEGAVGAPGGGIGSGGQGPGKGTGKTKERRAQQLFQVHVHCDHQIPLPLPLPLPLPVPLAGAEKIPVKRGGGIGGEREEREREREREEGGGGLLLPSMLDDHNYNNNNNRGGRKIGRPQSAAPRITTTTTTTTNGNGNGNGTKGNGKGAVPLGAVPHFAPGLGPGERASSKEQGCRPRTALPVPAPPPTTTIPAEDTNIITSDRYRYYDHGKPITDITSPYDRPLRNAQDRVSEVLQPQQQQQKVSVGDVGKKEPVMVVKEMQIPVKTKQRHQQQLQQQQQYVVGEEVAMAMAMGAPGGAPGLGGGGGGRSNARLIQQRQQTSYNIISGV